MVVQLQKPAPEWVQLTYTSSDTVGGAQGGWGIKEISAGADEDVVARLRQGVTTRLIEVTETSQFASDEQLKGRPRRLTFREDNGLLMLWHAASAGSDATGRPGNVFTHAAAMRSLDPSVQLQPIEYWRSEDWLAPFGSGDVGAARLGELRPGTVVTRTSVNEFVRESDRRITLEWLLAAVADMAGKRKSLVLATDTPDEAALWLGAISFLTSSPLARRLSWVTFERVSGVLEAAARGITVICVPRTDLPPLLEADLPDVLVVDPSWTVDEDKDRNAWAIPQTHRAFHRQPLWQAAMLDVFALPDDHTLRILAEVEGQTAGFEASEIRRLPLHWPLAMALLVDDGKPAVTDRPELIAACLAAAPRGALVSPVLQALRDELEAGGHAALLRQLPSSGRAASAAVPPAFGEADSVGAAVAYVNAGWRSAARGPQLTQTAARKVKELAGESIATAISEVELESSGNVKQLLAAARLVSFVVGYGLLPAPSYDDEPSPLADAVEIIKKRLADPAVRLSPEDLQGLHGSLVGQHKRSAPSTAGWTPDPPTRPVGRDTTADARRVPEADGSPAPDRLMDARATAPVPRAAPKLLHVDPDSLFELLAGAKDNPERTRAIGDCLLLTHGLRGVPPRLASLTLEEDTRRAELLLDAPDTSPWLKPHLTGWLVVAWALYEIGRVEYSLDSPSPPPAALLESLRTDPDRSIAALSAFIEESEEPHAARFLHAALHRHLVLRENSLLSLPVGRLTLGWSAVTRAFEEMPEQRRAGIVANAIPRVSRLSATHKAQVDEKLNDLLRKAEQGEGRRARGFGLRG